VSELHKFLFDGLPVRGMIVRLTDAWTEILRRRESNNATGAYALPVRELLGQMTAAGVLMQSNIKFNGALILQIFGDGPLKLAVAEVQPDLSLRATATVVGEVAADATLSQMVNVTNHGRCAITLDPLSKFPGQRPYQGVVPLFGDRHEKLEKLSEVLEHYMLQSEQLDTTLVLAASDTVAAGLLIQRMPVKGEGNLAGNNWGQIPNSSACERARDAAQSAATKLESDPNYSNYSDEIGRNEDYNRIATLAASLTQEELLTLDVDTVLRRLFWQEKLVRFEPRTGSDGPRFACNCSSERVSRMIRGLGQDEAASILAERGEIEVGCEFCGKQYRFDPIDAAQIFTAPTAQPPGSSATH
jgi:molecular chaperone Hsp33